MIHRYLLAALVLASAAFVTVPCAAQSKMDRATAAAEAAMPAVPNEIVVGDSATRQRYLESMQRYYEYRGNGYAYRSRVFEWQLASSRMIFVVVLTLVGAGVYFAAVQFRLAMRAGRSTGKTADTAGSSPDVSLATQFQFSTTGVVLNSSVMGVVILALSLAFFYLYLVYVYPIEDVF